MDAEFEKRMERFAAGLRKAEADLKERQKRPDFKPTTRKPGMPSCAGRDFIVAGIKKHDK